MVEQAHINVRAQRERIGMKPWVGASREDSLFKSYEDMTGFSAGILGVAEGLMYNPAAGRNACFNAIESGTVAGSNLFYVLSKLYLPWYAPEVQLVLQDNIALLGGFYIDCDVNKFFDSMTTLFSEEGLSAAGARGTSVYMFEYGKYKDIKKDPLSSTYQKGVAQGKLFGSITNYHI